MSSFKSSLPIIVLSLVMPACSAIMVQNPNEHSAYAPVNQAQGIGVVRWLNGGLQPIRNARKESAYKQMFEACAGRYEILSEGSQNEGAVAFATGPGMAMAAPLNWVYITFRCVPASAAPVAAAP